MENENSRIWSTAKSSTASSFVRLAKANFPHRARVNRIL